MMSATVEGVVACVSLAWGGLAVFYIARDAVTARDERRERTAHLLEPVEKAPSADE